MTGGALCNKCGDTNSLDSARALAEISRGKDQQPGAWRPRSKGGDTAAAAPEPIYQGIQEVKKNDEVDKLKVYSLVVYQDWNS